MTFRVKNFPVAKQNILLTVGPGESNVSCGLSAAAFRRPDKHS